MEIVAIVIVVFVVMLVIGSIDNARPVSEWSDEKLQRMHGKLLRASSVASSREKAAEYLQKSEEVEREIEKRRRKNVDQLTPEMMADIMGPSIIAAAQRMDEAIQKTMQKENVGIEQAQEIVRIRLKRETEGFLAQGMTQDQANAAAITKEIFTPPTSQPAEPNIPTLADRARAGDPEAQYVVGCNLLSDTARRNEGIEFLRQSTLQGFQHAPYALANVLFYAPGGFAEALSILEDAAVKGDRKSALLLSKIYHDGTGVEKNIAKAEEWLVRVRAPLGGIHEPIHDKVAADYFNLSLSHQVASLFSDPR